MSIAPEVAFEKLAQFTTGEEIAEFFLHEGIKGTRTSVLSCPIATWMTQLTGLRSKVSIDVRFYEGNEESDYFKSTQAMIEFIELFDHGDFPSLIKD